MSGINSWTGDGATAPSLNEYMKEMELKRLSEQGRAQDAGIIEELSSLRLEVSNLAASLTSLATTVATFLETQSGAKTLSTPPTECVSHDDGFHCWHDNDPPGTPGMHCCECKEQR